MQLLGDREHHAVRAKPLPAVRRGAGRGPSVAYGIAPMGYAARPSPGGLDGCKARVPKWARIAVPAMNRFRILPRAVLPVEMVDVAFDLSADTLPAHYEWALYRSVARAAPWLRGVAGAGIHPLRAAPGAGGSLVLAHPAELVLRMPRERLCAASVLEGAVLDVAGARVELGQGVLRGFVPCPTLHSTRVVTGDEREKTFAASIAAELRRLGIDRPFTCVRRADVGLEDGPAAAYGVAVRGLGAAASVLLQTVGLGKGRAIGCGLFVPDEAAVAPVVSFPEHRPP